MSIAVSATVLPSRILACMLVFMLVLVNVAIAYAGFSCKANKIYLSLLIFLCILLSLHILLKYYRRQRAFRLDISDAGDIIFRSAAPNAMNFDPMNMKLLEGSTLWPQLMVLTLHSEGSKKVVLLILRDSVDAVTFRKLAVALKWIAMHASSGTNFGADMPSGNF